MTATERAMASEEWARIELFQDAIREYAQHNSWRCEHREHNFYLVGRDAKKNPDCPCGLDATLRELGLAPETDEEGRSA